METLTKIQTINAAELALTYPLIGKLGRFNPVDAVALEFLEGNIGGPGAGLAQFNLGGSRRKPAKRGLDGRKMHASRKGTLTCNDYWIAIRGEFYRLLCTKERKYASIRSQIAAARGSATVIVSIITGYIVRATDVGAVLVAPLVALLLYSACAIGINSWCSANK